jgi:hypothetical protein
VAAWTDDELNRFGRAEEIDISPRRPDGSLRAAVPVWVVRHGDRLFIRSAVKGRNARWYRTVEQTHEGSVAARRTARDVRFTAADRALDEALDGEYRRKYGRYGSIVDSCLTPEARATTVEITPAS